MLIRFWRIVLEFFIRLTRGSHSPSPGSRHRNAPFAGRSKGIAAEAPREVNEIPALAPKPATFLPAALTLLDRRSVDKGGWRDNRPHFNNLIEVSCVEGELLSKSLQSREAGVSSPRIILLVAAVLVTAIALAGVKNISSTKVAHTSQINSMDHGGAAIEKAAASAASDEAKAVPGSADLRELPPAASAALVTEKSSSTAGTNTPPYIADRAIASLAGETTAVRGDAALVTRSPAIEETKPDVNRAETVSGRSAGAAPGNDKPQKVIAMKNDGVTSVSKTSVAARPGQERTHPTRHVRSLSGAVPETVVNGLLGGLAGAMVGGPVGLVAGAAVGASAGKAIAHSWGLK